MEPCAEAAKGGGGDNELNTYKNNSHTIQNKWNTYINILGQRIHSTHTHIRIPDIHMPNSSSSTKIEHNKHTSCEKKYYMHVECNNTKRKSQ